MAPTRARTKMATFILELEGVNFPNSGMLMPSIVGVLLNITCYDPEAVERYLRLMILAHGVQLI